jgi:hypothetical protein
MQTRAGHVGAVERPDMLLFASTRKAAPALSFEEPTKCPNQPNRPPTLPSTCRRSPPAPKGRRHEGRCLAKPTAAVHELVEIEVTRDHANDVGVFIQPPPDPGWRVLDAHRERFTQWQRRGPLIRIRKRRRK